MLFRPIINLDDLPNSNYRFSKLLHYIEDNDANQLKNFKQITMQMIKNLFEAAEEGVEDAWNFLEDIYLDKYMIDEYIEYAIIWCNKKSFFKKKLEVMSYRIAQFYHLKSPKIAFKWYQNTANYGNTLAMLEVADFYAEGKIVDQSCEIAFRYYVAAIDKENKEIVSYRLKKICESKGKDYPQMFHYLGNLYLNGKFGKIDFINAMNYFKLAAESGINDAQVQIGDLYFRGFDVPMNENFTEAFKWYYLAASTGKSYPVTKYNQLSSHAQNTLGCMYFEGLGVSQDYLKAINWFLKSASQGNEAAMANVGVVFYQIYGESDDYMKSLKWFHKAGGKYYIFQVGKIFDKKWQVAMENQDQNKAKEYLNTALEYYCKAADLGIIYARINTGYCICHYLNKNGKYGDPLEWYNLARIEGYTNALKIIDNMQNYSNEKKDSNLENYDIIINVGLNDNYPMKVRIEYLEKIALGKYSKKKINKLIEIQYSYRKNVWYDATINTDNRIAWNEDPKDRMAWLQIIAKQLSYEKNWHLPDVLVRYKDCLLTNKTNPDTITSELFTNKLSKRNIDISEAKYNCDDVKRNLIDIGYYCLRILCEHKKSRKFVCFDIYTNDSKSISDDINKQKLWLEQIKKDIAKSNVWKIDDFDIKVDEKSLDFIVKELKNNNLPSEMGDFVGKEKATKIFNTYKLIFERAAAIILLLRKERNSESPLTIEQMKEAFFNSAELNNIELKLDLKCCFEKIFELQTEQSEFIENSAFEIPADRIVNNLTRREVFVLFFDMLKKATSDDKDKLINTVNSVKENFMPKVGAEISLPMRDLELRCQRLIGPKFMTIIKNIVGNITCKYIDTKEWEKFISGLQRLMGNGWNVKNVCLSLMNKNITNSIQFPDNLDYNSTLICEYIYRLVMEKHE